VAEAPLDPAKDKQLLAERRYPRGIEDGPHSPPSTGFDTAWERRANNLNAVGIRGGACARNRARRVYADAGEEARGSSWSRSANSGNAAAQHRISRLLEGRAASGAATRISKSFMQQVRESGPRAPRGVLTGFQQARGPGDVSHPIRTLRGLSG